MTVGKMINLLKTMNPKAEVKLHERFGEPVLFVVALQNDENTVWLETESDNDMAAEIEARFENASEKQLDELDFYMDMLETGIDVGMVRKYMGNEAADHMLGFCRNHGLIDEVPKLSFSWRRFTKVMFELAKQNI